MTPVLLVVGTYLGVVAVALSLGAAAGDADDAMAREIRPHALPTGRSLTQVAAAVHGALEAERVMVVVRDPGDPARGRIGACIGAPHLVGGSIALGAAPAAGVIRAPEARLLGLPWPPRTSALWRYAHVPLTHDGRVAGAVVVARRWRAFTEEEISFVEHIALEGPTVSHPLAVR
jgi:GAF domain-containing protein